MISQALSREALLLALIVCGIWLECTGVLRKAQGQKPLLRDRVKRFIAARWELHRRGDPLQEVVKWLAGQGLVTSSTTTGGAEVE